jgi:protein involved in polysaccharide export with SLBB domain
MDEVVSDGATIRGTDLFLISVESKDEDLTVITERGNGRVTVPHVGSMPLEGLTLGKAREAIQRAVAARSAGTTVRLWVYRER